MESFPNTASHWITRLKHPISLKGKWEMSLVEMQYINSLFTLPRAQRIIVRIMSRIYLKPKVNEADADELDRFAYDEHVIIFPPGHYATSEDFLRIFRAGIPKTGMLRWYNMVRKPSDPDAIPTYVEEEGDVLNEGNAHLPVFDVDLLDQADLRICFKLKSARVYVFFPPDSVVLQKILGFDHSDVYFDMARDRDDQQMWRVAKRYLESSGDPQQEKIQETPVIAPRPLNPQLGSQSLFVYCDVADYSLVGDSASQLLRTVSIKGRFMELVTERFDIPHYVPVLTSHFETIEISIGTDLEDFAKFATGKTLVKLHFRPLRPY